MKHIKNAIVFTAMFIYQLFVTLVGIITIPFYMFSTEDFICTHAESLPNKKFSNSWYDSFFGNSEDGLLGDVYYKAKTTPSWWTTYNWCAWRNPIHNLALRMGVNEVIVNYVWIGNRYTEDKIGHEGFVYSEAIGESGKVYPMYRYCKLLYKDYGIEFNMGYKNFNIQEVNKHYKYSFTVSINPFKKFEA